MLRGVRDRFCCSSRDSAKKTHCDWQFLAPPVIQILATVLKRTQRWRTDGPSIRLVNRHWSQVISQNILEIRPHASRKIVKADLKALKRFPQLTSVDVGRFLVEVLDAPQPSKNARIFRGKKRAPYAAEVDRVVQTLSQLPNLTQLEVSEKLVRMEHEHVCAGNCALWTNLTRITSLYVYNKNNMKLYGNAPENTSWQLERFLLWPDRMNELKTFVEELPGLKSLAVFVHHPHGIRDLSFLQRMESVKLYGVDSMSFIRSVSNSSSIVSLRAEDPSSDDMTRISTYQNLDSLIVNLDSESILFNHKFTSCLRNLAFLELQGSFPYDPLPDDFFREICGVQSLRLSSFAFDGQAMMDSLTCLTSLSINYCYLKTGLSFLSRPNKLQSLTMYHLLNGGMEMQELTLGDMLLPEVRALVTASYNDRRLLESIATFSKLEVLSVLLEGTATEKDLQELERLPRLRFLCLEFDKCPRKVLSMLSPRLLGNLEWLCLRDFDQTWRTRRVVKKIKKKVPQIILETSEVDLARFDRAHFI